MAHRKTVFWIALLLAVLLWPTMASAQMGTVTDDAFLSSSSTTQALNLNGQGIQLIVAGSSAKVGSVAVGSTTSYIKFQLVSSLPPSVAAANVTKATLKLYLSPSTAPTGAIDIYPITSAWSESALSGSAPPTIASTPVASNIVLGSANSFLVVDVTQLVQDWLEGVSNGGFVNDGIAILPHTSNTFAVFDSKESIVTSHEPRLEIVLTSSGAPGPAGPQGPQGATGPAGSAATITVGTTTTGAPGSPALVTNAGNANAALLNFTIPQGGKGPQGPAGPQGTTGLTGPQGSMGPQGTQGVAGPAGPQGQQGIPGVMGPLGPQGPVGINNRGAWSNSTTYGPNDAVFDSASYWLALSANSNSEPFATNTNWQLIAGGIVNRGVWNASNNYNVNDAVTDGGSFWLALVPMNATTSPSTSCEPTATGCSANWQLLAAQGAAGASGAQGPAGPQGPQGVMGLQGLPGPMPTGAALTTTSNTFSGTQTINGNLVVSGSITFADGTSISSASGLGSGGGTGGTGGGGGTSGGSPTCAPYQITSSSPVAPSGYIIYQTKTTGDVWSTMPALPTPRDFLAATTDKAGNIYAIGGSDSTGFLSTVEMFNPTTQVWTTLPNMPTPRNALAAATDAQGNIYAIGGWNAAGPLNTVEMFNPGTQTWTSLPGMPTPRNGLAAATDLAGYIYAIGGYNSTSGILSTVEMYNPTYQTWSTMPSLLQAGNLLAAATDLLGNIYAVGGGTTPIFEVYNPTTLVWTNLPPPAFLEGMITSAAAADKQGNIYLMGGTGPISTVLKYNPGTQIWSPVSSMLTARAGLAAATDAQGNIYAIGGDTKVSFFQTAPVLNTVEMYTPAKTSYTFLTTDAMAGGTCTPPTKLASTSAIAPPGYAFYQRVNAGTVWVPLQPMLTPRVGLAAAADKAGKIYAIGGANAGQYLNTLELYNPSTQAWATLPGMPTPRSGLAAVTTAAGKIFAIGGSNASGYLATVEAFDPASGSWTQVASMPTPRNGLAVAMDANGKIYAMGGYNSSGFLATVEIYDPTAGVWTTGPNMITARAGLAAATDVQGNIYALGGSTDTNYSNNLNVAEMYIPAAGSWSSLAGMAIPRAWLGAASDKQGNIYTIGGASPGSGGASAQVFNPTTQVWSSLPSMSTPRTGPAAATDTHGNIYVLGGTSSAANISYPWGTLASVEMLTTPPTPIYIFVKQ